MKNRGTYLLLGLFFVGLVGYWYLDRRVLPDRDRVRRVGGRVLPQLLETRPDDLRKVVIRDQTPGAKVPAVVLERRGRTGWQMTEPSDVAADPVRVETLAFALKEMIRIPEAGEIPTGPQLKEFGLDPAQKSLELWGSDEAKPLVELEIGNVNVNRRFVRVKGRDSVDVVDANLIRAIDLSAEAWREHQVVRVPTFQVVGLKVAGQGRELEAKRYKDHWRLNRPFQALGEDAKIEAVLAEITSAKVTGPSGFAADGVKDLARFGLEKPRATVTLTVLSRDGSTSDLGFDIGAHDATEKGKLYLRQVDQDDVLLVEAKPFENLGLDPNGLRSQRLVDFPPTIITAFEVKTADQTLVFARDRRDWYLIKPAESKVDRQAMADFLKQFGDLQTSVFLDPKSTPQNGLVSPSVTIKAWVGTIDDRLKAAEPQGKPRAVVRLGRRDANRRVVYAQTEGDERTLLAIPDKFLESVPRSPFSMRERIVLRLDPAQLDTISIERAGGNLSLRSPSRPEDRNLWQVASPTPGPTDPESLGRLFALLTGVPAEAYVADNITDRSQYGLQSPAIRFSWTSRPPSPLPPSEKTKPGTPALPRGPETGTILIGGEVPGRGGSRFAMVEGRPTVFILASALVRIFESEIRDRLVLSFPIDKVKRVAFRWPKRSLTLVPPPSERPGDPWGFDGPVLVQPGFDPGRVGGLLKVLSELKAERFVTNPGPIPGDAGLGTPQLRIELQFQDDRPPSVLRIGKSNGLGFVLATNEPGPFGPVFLLDESVWTEWLKPARLGEELPADVFAP